MEHLRSTGLLVLAVDLKEETATESGIIIPEHDRASIPLRAEVIAVPFKLMQSGLLPGDIVLYTAQTREKICIQFQSRLEHPTVTAIPPECIVAYIPADKETRKKAVEHMKSIYSDELLEVLQGMGTVEDVKVMNNWNM